MIEREEGYYWIRFKDDLYDICIGYYENKTSTHKCNWTICGSNTIFDDSDVIVINKIEGYKLVITKDTELVFGKPAESIYELKNELIELYKKINIVNAKIRAIEFDKPINVYEVLGQAPKIWYTDR